MASQCFHDGDFWYAVATTTAGQSPTTHPQLWRRIEIPAAWRGVLALKMEARILGAEGQHDKARSAMSEAEQRLDALRITRNHRGGRLPRMLVRGR